MNELEDEGFEDEFAIAEYRFCSQCNEVAPFLDDVCLQNEYEGTHAQADDVETLRLANFHTELNTRFNYPAVIANEWNGTEAEA